MSNPDPEVGRLLLLALGLAWASFLNLALHYYVEKALKPRRTQ